MKKLVKSLIIGSLASVVLLSGIQVASAATETFTWTKSTLSPSSTITPTTLWSTNSKGALTWTASGPGCSRVNNKIVTTKKGKCTVTVTITKTSKQKLVKSRDFTLTSTAATTTTVAKTTTTVALTCATGGTCVVGDTGPGGGTVFYVASSSFTSGAACGSSCKYLEAAPTGWTTTSGCSSEGTSIKDPRCIWSGNTGTSVTTATGIGAGFANTSAIIAQDSTAGKAATASRAFNSGKKTDWFLPSKAELNELCKFARTQTTGDSSVVCGSSGSLKTGFTSDGYWSSSEYSANYAWFQYFSGEVPLDNIKVFPGYVRPVRAF